MSGKSILSERLGFIGLDDKACQELARLKPLLDEEMPRALAFFYEKIAAKPAVSRLFDDRAHMDKAKSAQAGHWPTSRAGASPMST